MREIARFVGSIATVVLAVATQLLDNGLVTSDQAKNVLHLIIVLTPIISAEIIRNLVTPVSDPVLPIGTSVTTPGQDPDAPPAAVVSGASPNR